MTKLEKTLRGLGDGGRSGHRPILMTHVVLGYPSLGESLELVRIMADSGASMVELQIPFSDPMADGPTIMHANEVALAGGLRTRDCMKAMEELNSELDLPLLFMSYLNVCYSYGRRRRRAGSRDRGGLYAFLKDASSAGAEGSIIADIPPEDEVEGYWSTAKELGILPVPLVAPVSDERRLEKIKGVLSPGGFVYCVSTTGTTGARDRLSLGLGAYLKRVRRALNAPLAVGFGLSRREHLRAVGRYAEIAVVGSAVIRLVENTSKRNRGRLLRNFIRDLLR